MIAADLVLQPEPCAAGVWEAGWGAGSGSGRFNGSCGISARDVGGFEDH
jgi:hypothetical protein